MPHSDTDDSFKRNATFAILALRDIENLGSQAKRRTA
jgi:hypothetical protein